MVVTWGLIGLARSALTGDSVGGDVASLAGALALIFVGVPVFLLHWWLAQRAAREDDEERFSRVRAIFLYGALLATLIPITQNVLALVNRMFFDLFDASGNQVIFGYGQTWSDNVIAIVFNGLIAVYFFNVIRLNWAEDYINEAFWETRRLYRFVWVVYGLVLMIFGVQQTLLYLTRLLADDVGSQTILANGLAMILVGVPLWIFSWRVTQRVLDQPGEQQSLLRLVVLYAIRLISLVVTLFSVGAIVDVAIRGLLGDVASFAPFVGDIQDPLSVAVPMGIIWAYHSTILRRENYAFPEVAQRVGLQRLYAYLLALLGLITVVVGLHELIFAAIGLLPIDDIVDQRPIHWTRVFRRDLAASLSILLVGLPLWLTNWIPINRTATSEGDAGDQIRRSIIRRSYLYLVLFGSVIGVMVSAGMLIFHLLQAALGEPDREFVRLVIELISSLVIFGLLLWYHGRLLQADGRLAARTLAERHAEFPVLVLVSEIGGFSEMMVAALQKEAPTLPVVVHVVDQGIPDETLSSAKAVILPASITAYPLEAIRLWLQNFSGVRFVIPTQVNGWVWASGNGDKLKDLIYQTAEMVRKLAEGEEISRARLSPWIIVGYIFGGLLGLLLLLIVFSSLIELLN
jgi:hypothetical protein